MRSTASSPITSIDSMIQRIHSLPPDLFNVILSAFSTLHPPHPITLTKSHKPPPQLQICRPLRQEILRLHLDSIDFEVDDLDLLFNYLSSIPADGKKAPTWLDLVKSIHLHTSPPASEADDPRAAFARVWGYSKEVFRKLTGADGEGRVFIHPLHDRIFVNALKRNHQGEVETLWLPASGLRLDFWVPSVGHLPRTMEDFVLISGFEWRTG